MWPTIRSVIISYLAIVALVFTSFSAAFLIMGADATFEPSSYDVTTAWIVVSIVLGLVAAILGGYLCAVISKTATGPKALAGVMFVLGLLFALPALVQSDETIPAMRSAAVGNFEAMQSGVQPIWIMFLNPLVGAVGVILGARFRTQRSSRGSQDPSVNKS